MSYYKKKPPLRISAVQKEKLSLFRETQQTHPWPVEDQLRMNFVLEKKESLRRKLVLWGAPYALRFQQPAIQNKIGFNLSFPHDLLSIGERFCQAAALSVLLRKIRPDNVQRVLIPGCSLGKEDVQFWLRRGIKRVAGIDIAFSEESWAQVRPLLEGHFNAKVDFRSASVEKMPFENDSFDLLASAATLEHVRNLSGAIAEMARVLRPGGWAFHGIGPLYYAFAGDHCISSYGKPAGYDHLLLEDADYQAAIRNDALFSTQPDPNCRHWALHNQFSFGKPAEYVSLFSEHFEIQNLFVVISEEGLEFREKYPGKWRALLGAGLSEEDLLVKAFHMVLRKPACH